MPLIVDKYSDVVASQIFNPYDITIKIGRFCAIALNFRVISGEHPTVKHPECVASIEFPKLLHIFPQFKDVTYPTAFLGSPINICNDVWIGADVHVKHGVTIEDGAIVGACSVVTKDVKPYEIVAGNPARHIRFRFTDEQIKRLLEIKWWDWSIDKIKDNIDCIADINKLLNKF